MFDRGIYLIYLYLHVKSNFYHVAVSELREALTSQKNFKVWLPGIKRCTDNTAMITAAGYNAFMRGRENFIDSKIVPASYFMN